MLGSYLFDYNYPEKQISCNRIKPINNYNGRYTRNFCEEKKTRAD